MKFSLIAAVVLLALAQGSFAQDSADLEKLGRYLEDMKDKMVRELTDIINTHDLANQATSFVNEKKIQLEPLVAQIQEQLQAVASNAEAQIKPLAANVQAQFQPQIDSFQQQIDAIMQQLTRPAAPIAN
ncbi:antifreeze protein type IV precursor [Notothenia coriiceps]|uniref:Type-4 ice-structuring protein LS-12-like n=2 Tax=Notothenia coriiceps TaxID=8208 RepID=E7CXR2_9TELE|nr:antifreeze protein type IV precursor [Notothenia coriiceps]ADU02181.1 type-IV antifreeze protein [Notothenia coriiceps]ADU02183.1 type-IV antifreeze protein [Notothenia coriiceps]